MSKAKALLKTGETVELPFEEMVEYVTRHPELIQEQEFENPLPPRRSQSKEAENSLTSNK